MGRSSPDLKLWRLLRNSPRIGRTTTSATRSRPAVTVNGGREGSKRTKIPVSPHIKDVNPAASKAFLCIGTVSLQVGTARRIASSASSITRPLRRDDKRRDRPTPPWRSQQQRGGLC